MHLIVWRISPQDEEFGVDKRNRVLPRFESFVIL